MRSGCRSRSIGSPPKINGNRTMSAMRSARPAAKTNAAVFGRSLMPYEYDTMKNTRFFRMNQPKFTDAPEAVSLDTASDTSFGDILTQFEQTHRSGGETVEGTVVSVTPDGVFVDIGR